MSDLKQHLNYDLQEEANAIARRISERVEEAKKEWEGIEPETKEEAMAIVKPLMEDVAKQMTKDLMKLIVKSAVKGVLDAQEQEKNAPLN